MGDELFFGVRVGISEFLCMFVVSNNNGTRGNGLSSSRETPTSQIGKRPGAAPDKQKLPSMAVGLTPSYVC
jgi:hypothetical protein